MSRASIVVVDKDDGGELDNVMAMRGKPVEPASAAAGPDNNQ